MEYKKDKDGNTIMEFHFTVPAYESPVEDKNVFHKIANFFEDLWFNLFFVGAIFKSDGSTTLRRIKKKNIIHVTPHWDEEKQCYVSTCEAELTQ